MPFPLASEGFVVKTFDSLETRRSRYSDDILPFLVTLQDLNWKPWYAPDHSTVFVNFPHAVNVLSYIWYVNAFVGLTLP